MMKRRKPTTGHKAASLEALRSQRWSGEWDIPVFSLGRQVSEDDVRSAVADAANGRYRCTEPGID